MCIYIYIGGGGGITQSIVIRIKNRHWFPILNIFIIHVKIEKKNHFSLTFHFSNQGKNKKHKDSIKVLNKGTNYKIYSRSTFHAILVF